MQYKLYHKDIYLPEYLISEIKKEERILTKYPIIFSNHIQEHFKTIYCRYSDMEQRIIDIIRELTKVNVIPFELETKKDYKVFKDYREHINKIVVRVPFSDTIDISIVIMPRNGYGGNKCTFVKTAWLNNAEDNHKTLDITRYQTN